jgi:hypothetical protein
LTYLKDLSTNLVPLQAGLAAQGTAGGSDEAGI